MRELYLVFFFFFNDTATTEIYTLSLHDALPICHGPPGRAWISGTAPRAPPRPRMIELRMLGRLDRKSTRLNSSHGYISYAVFCLKKKNRRSLSIRYVARWQTSVRCLAP